MSRSIGIKRRYILGAAVIVVGICFLIFHIPKRTDHAEILLKQLYHADANTLSNLPEELEQVTDHYQSMYAAYMTPDGFDSAMAGRTFIKTAKLAAEQNTGIDVKKVLLYEKDTVKDFSGKQLYRYDYKVECGTSDGKALTFTGTLNLTKLDGEWLVDQIIPDSIKNEY